MSSYTAYKITDPIEDATIQLKRKQNATVFVFPLLVGGQDGTSPQTLTSVVLGTRTFLCRKADSHYWVNKSLRHQMI